MAKYVIFLSSHLHIVQFIHAALSSKYPILFSTRSRYIALSLSRRVSVYACITWCILAERLNSSIIELVCVGFTTKNRTILFTPPWCYVVERARDREPLQAVHHAGLHGTACRQSWGCCGYHYFPSSTENISCGPCLYGHRETEWWLFCDAPSVSQ